MLVSAECKVVQAILTFSCTVVMIMFGYVIGFVVVVDVRSMVPSRSQVMGQFEGKYSEVGIQLGGMANPLGFGWLLLSFPVGCSRISMKN